LESVDSAKYLGITLQSNLKWNKHIDQTASKANKTHSFVRRNLKVDKVTFVGVKGHEPILFPFSCSLKVILQI
jgi:hypothetical protein